MVKNSNVSFTDNARKILEKRYLRKGEDGFPTETPEQMFERIADTVAEPDRPYRDVEVTKIEFYNLLSTKKFFPNSPTFTGAGTPLGQLAACFVLRVAAGVSIIEVQRFSPWLYVVTTLLALYLGFGKRRAELSVLINDNPQSHRKVLSGYSIALVDQYITVVSASTIIAYSLYTFSGANLPDNHALMLTIPFVLYGILRYLFLIQMRNEGGEPEEILLKDRPIQVAVLLWAITVMVIFYLY